MIQQQGPSNRAGLSDSPHTAPQHSIAPSLTAWGFRAFGAAQANLAAMPTDPTGITDALAEIPKGQLSERQHRMAAGLALIDAGSSISAASRECGIPYTTLYQQHRGITASDRENTFQRGEDALIDAQLTIASRASEIVLERLDADTMRDADVIKAMGVATDKVAIKRQWARGSGASDVNTRDALTEALESVMRGGSVTVTGPDPISEAVEVEAITGDVD